MKRRQNTGDCRAVFERAPYNPQGGRQVQKI